MTKKATKLPITVRHYFRKSLMRIMRQDLLAAGYPKSSIHADELTYQYLSVKTPLNKSKTAHYIVF